jgi:hypothetical protein
MKNRKDYSTFLAFFLSVIFTLFLFPIQSRAEVHEAGKLMNVVYDDSGSMVKDGETMCAKWSQAKYALEVFGAMMGEKDIMNIFPMSLEGQKGITIEGKDAGRVSAIHEMNAIYNNTPFTTVTAAAEDLAREDEAYEKWLIILTDGEFDDGATPKQTVQDALNGYASQGFHIVYLAIGSGAAELKGNKSAGFYSERAADGTQILMKVTSIANQIFEHQVLGTKYIRTSGNTQAFSFDIPTDQIIVFAQGENVSVGNLSFDGQDITPAEVINVKYSDVKPENPDYQNAVVDTTLCGVVSVYSSGSKPFPDGSYSVDVANARETEIYYKPGVTVDCGLEFNGKPVNENDAAYAGDYGVNLNFTNPLTGKPVESELLKDAKFSLEIENNGKTQTITKKKGKVSLTEGEVRMIASAELPGNVFLKNEKDYKVLPEPLKLNIKAEPPSLSYMAGSLGKKAPPTKITVSHADGSPLTETEWKNTKLGVKSEAGSEKLSWLSEPGTQSGTWLIRPDAAGTADVPTGDIHYHVSADYHVEDQYAIGNADATVSIQPYAGTPLKIELKNPQAEYSVADIGKTAEVPVIVLALNQYTGQYEPVSEDVWQATDLSVSCKQRMDWKAERGTAASEWVLKPNHKKLFGFLWREPLITQNGEVNIHLDANGALGDKTYSGGQDEAIRFNPFSRAAFLKLFIPRLIELLLFLIIVIGYLTKKRFNFRKLHPSRRELNPARAPVFTRKPEKNFLSVILPLGPETAVVKCKSSIYGCNFPNLRIRAEGGNTFSIINYMDIRPKVTKINGATVEDVKKLKRRQFSLGTFYITSLDPKTNRPTGEFKFK